MNHSQVGKESMDASALYDKTEEFNIGGAVDFSWLVRQRDSFWDDDDDSLLDKPTVMDG